MKKFSLIRASIPGFFGFVGLCNTLGGHRVAGTDIIVLLASGFGFAATLEMLLIWFKTRKERGAAG